MKAYFGEQVMFSSDCHIPGQGCGAECSQVGDCAEDPPMDDVDDW